MSKGHQAHRRRAYGRRQHELHERRTRHEVWRGLESAAADSDDGGLLETFEAFRPARRFVDLLARRPDRLAEAG